MQTAAAGRARGDALAAVADAYRSYAREHPGSYTALQHTPDPHDAVEVLLRPAGQFRE